MQPIRLNVHYGYMLAFVQDMFSIENDTLIRVISAQSKQQRVHSLAVYIDSNVALAWPGIEMMIGNYVQHYSAILSLSHEPLVIPGGEAGKNMQTVNLLHEHMLEAGLDRQSCILAIGGGACLDTIGYAAATFHRGVRIIRVPTTVLAQNDAGIGVKNGVNAYGIKNLLGSFAPPFAVINDSSFLKTLSVRDRRAGIAEAIKVALIRDKVFFEWLEEHALEFVDVGSSAMNWLIQRCAQLHIEQICNGGDPFETGNARPLDYGHWSAHKIEVLSGYQLNHGEAVAIGMALDALYAVDEGILHESVALRVLSLLQTVGFCLWHPCLNDHTEAGESCLLQGLEEFRQHLGGHLCITLLSDIGCSTEVDHINKSSVFRARKRLKLLSCA